MTKNAANVPVKSVDRTLTLVETLQERGGASVTELAAEMNVAKSTVHNHLLTLKRRGYVTEIDGEYQVGLQFLDLGVHARDRNPSYQEVQSKVRELADETAELCSFVTEQEGVGIIVHQEKGDQGVQTQSRVGTCDHLHALPGGKAILASLDSTRVDQIIERHGLPVETDYTITDPDALKDELDEIAERRYAVNQEEYLPSLYAISVPVRTSQRDVVGALTIVGPAHKFSNQAVEETIADQLLGVSNELELNLTYSRR